jgi:hypothetical protein
MTPRGALAAVALTLALAVSGCGASGDDADDARSSAPSGSTAPDEAGPADRDLDSSMASDLASLAEDLAGEDTSGSVAPRDGTVLGADISWPQCPRGMGIPERPTEGMPMPVDEAEYVVIGLTNGPAFTPNPCLADQVDWAAERELLVSAYSVLSFPTRAQLREHGATGPFDADSRLGALRNVGYQQARYNLANLDDAGFETPMVWLDVEPVTIWEWTGDLAANAAVVAGAARGYRDAGYEIGVYSTPYLWEQIVGDYALGIPEWRAAGETSRAEALSRCGDDWSIQGGTAVLGQWVADRRDHNVTCPGIAADLGRWFHQY